MSWGLAPGKTFASHENGGQWFGKLANQRDGSALPAGAPGWMMNVGGGNRYALGDYHPSNESWTTSVATATIDSGPNSNWECATNSPPPQTPHCCRRSSAFVPPLARSPGPAARWRADGGFVGERFMNIGWSTGGNKLPVWRVEVSAAYRR
jgi:hypothetical protein